MKYMIPAFLVLIPALALQEKPPVAPEDKGDKKEAALIERGSYLVHSVAMCVQCHSPRTPDGKLIDGRQLHGEVMPIVSPFQNTRWASRAPHIAGLPGYSKEQGVRLLTEGIAANGGTPQGPMPPFRMSKDDAEAVVAYLKSLP